MVEFTWRNVHFSFGCVLRVREGSGVRFRAAGTRTPPPINSAVEACCVEVHTHTFSVL